MPVVAPRPIIRYAISDGSLAPGQPFTPLIEFALALRSRHVHYLQIREPQLTPRALESLASAIIAALDQAEPSPQKPHSPRILINHRPDIAIAARAHGVHLRSAPSELTPSEVRAIYAASGAAANPPAPIISIACHSLDDVRRAAADSPDLILFAPVFEKPQPNAAPLPGAGLNALRAACAAAVGIPVLALGGVTPLLEPQCLNAGAAGIAGIRTFTTPEHSA
jgi:thiamine-phosphate pyrophosphorylase